MVSLRSSWMWLVVAVAVPTNVFGVAADYSEEMDQLPAAAGWGFYDGDTDIDGLLNIVHPGGVPGTWFHGKNTQGGAIAPANDGPGGTPWKGPLAGTSVAVNGVTRAYTIDLRFKMSNYNLAALIDADGNPAVDSVPDGNPAWDPAGGLGGATAESAMAFSLEQVSKHSGLMQGYLGFSSFGYGPPGNTPGTGITGSNLYSTNFASVRGGDNGHPNSAGAFMPPGVANESLSGIDLGSPAWQNSWHILRLQASIDSVIPFGDGNVTPLGDWQGRFKFMLGDGDGTNFITFADFDAVGSDIAGSRDRNIAIRAMGSNSPYAADLEFDYMRVSKSIVPDGVLIGPQGAGAGNIVMSGTSNMEIGGVRFFDYPGTGISRDLIPGTDFDIVRATGTVTLGGTVNFRGATREGGPPSGGVYPDDGASAANAGRGDGNTGIERRAVLPDIGQGPSRFNPDFDDQLPPHPITNPEFLVVNPALHRGSKIVREGIIKGNLAVNSILGDFAAVTYEGAPNSALNETGLFVKAVKADSNKRVDFVLLNAKLGDADGDEVVSSSDVFTTLSNLGAATVGEDWNRGNFDGDSSVSSSDVFTALSNLGSYTPTAIADISSVPEPTSGLLMVLAMGACAGLRRSRQGR